MEKFSTYEQAHLIVAAIRLFVHREGKMPTVEEISSEVGFPVEVTNILCNQLLDLGVLKLVSGAFDDRFEVGDHVKIEELPRSVDEGGMEREIEKFRAERVDRQKKIEEMFDKEEFERTREEQLKKLEEEFKEHMKKRSKPTDPTERGDR